MGELRRGRLERPLMASGFDEAIKSMEFQLPTELVGKVKRAYEAEMRRILHDVDADANAITEQIAITQGFKSADQMLHAYMAMQLRKTKEEAGESVRPIQPRMAEIYAAVERTQVAIGAVIAANDLSLQRQIGRTLEHAALAVMIEDEAERTQSKDELTGLIDSQEFVFQRLRAEIQNFLRAEDAFEGKELEVDEPASQERESDPNLMLWVEIDLDDFKILNEIYGHIDVDYEILQPLSKRLQDTFRETDVICRLGGDEFSIIFLNVKKSAVPVLGKKIIDTIHQVKLPDTTKYHAKPDQLTASVGIFEIDRKIARAVDLRSTGDAMAKIRKPADIAASRSKMLGKDRFTVYDPDAPEITPTFDVYLKAMLRKHSAEVRLLRRAHEYDAITEFEQHIAAASRVSYEKLYRAAA